MGIGKLALFSIADEIEVHTRSETEKHAFRMKAADIRKAISKQQDYFPVPITFAGPKRVTSTPSSWPCRMESNTSP